MAKKKTELAAIVAEIITGSDRNYVINGDIIKDDFCKYKYEIVKGVGKLNQYTGNGVHIVKESMKEAFAELNVHMANIDDVFKHADMEFDSLNEVGNEDLTFLYEVSGFQIEGSEENESVILLATKKISSGNRMNLKSPKIPLGDTSWYRWYNELKESISKCREEVALYHEGNYIELEPEEKPNPNQSSISFGPGDARENEMTDEEFENAAL